MKLFFFAIFFTLVVFFLLEYKIVGQAVYGDGRYYWAFTRSLYFDRNIDISSEMAHYYSPRSNNEPVLSEIVPELRYKTKEITHGFSLGISLLWLPFFAISDMVVIFLSSIGVPVIRNGYSDLYQIIVGIENILCIISGLYILFQLLRKYFSIKVVIPTLLLTLFATNLLYYGSLDVLNSHPFSFFLVTVLLWFYFIYQEKKEWKYLFIQGLVVGFLATNRTQDILFIVVPFFSIVSFFPVRSLSSPRNRGSRYVLDSPFPHKGTSYLVASQGNDWKGIGQKLLVVFLGVFLGYLPQVILISIGQGHLSFLPHTEQGFVFPQYFLGILFDTKLGIAWYMPVWVIGVIGVVLGLRERKQKNGFFLVSLVIMLLHLVLIASWEGWRQASYSMRYFISLLPLIAFGLAEVVSMISKRYSQVFLYCLVSLFILHQVVMILGFKLFWQDPTMVGTELSRSGKLKMEVIQLLQQSSFWQASMRERPESK